MPQNASLPTYSAIYAFGDSLSDSGNLSITTSISGVQPVSPPYFKQNYGRVSGNDFSNGPTWVQNLSLALNLGTLSPSLTGGNNFAYGGAETGPTPQNAANPAIQGISLPAQYTQFQSAVSKPSANALYTVSSGANDLLGILANPALTAQQQATDVTTAVTNELGFINRLIAGGAKTLLVLNVPDLGKTPDVLLGLANGSNIPSAALVAQATQLSAQYDTALVTQLAAIDAAGTANVQVVDTFGLINTAIANPAVYGLTNVTGRVWSGNYTDGNSGTLAAATPEAQDSYLFWDRLHPTETGHQAIAAAAEKILSGAPVLTVVDTTIGQSLTVAGHPYTGPAPGPRQQYIATSADNLGITVTTPDWFILGGSGQDSIMVSSGNNILDGGLGSSFLTGGSGTDSFYVDARNATSNSWSTVNNFHAGEAVTLWGVSASDFSLAWVDGLGAPGSTGLTLIASSIGKPVTSVTLAGFTQSDLIGGRISIAFGTEPVSGNRYTYIHANA